MAFPAFSANLSQQFKAPAETSSREGRCGAGRAEGSELSRGRQAGFPIYHGLCAFIVG